VLVANVLNLILCSLLFVQQRQEPDNEAPAFSIPILKNSQVNDGQAYLPF
jgi:hypothetical protein